jgi:hypothetical protein
VVGQRTKQTAWLRVVIENSVVRFFSVVFGVCAPSVLCASVLFWRLGRDQCRIFPDEIVMVLGRVCFRSWETDWDFNPQPDIRRSGQRHMKGLVPVCHSPAADGLYRLPRSTKYAGAWADGTSVVSNAVVRVWPFVEFASFSISIHQSHNDRRAVRNPSLGNGGIVVSVVVRRRRQRKQYRHDKSHH